MQLAAFNNNNFVLGHTAMLINEGLPLYLVLRLEDRFDLPR
jgi:UDP-N-acetyl-D-mannosaminuronic acid dehydrogenase